MPVLEADSRRRLFPSERFGLEESQKFSRSPIIILVYKVTRGRFGYATVLLRLKHPASRALEMEGNEAESRA